MKQMRIENTARGRGIKMFFDQGQKIWGLLLFMYSINVPS